MDGGAIIDGHKLDAEDYAFYRFINDGSSFKQAKDGTRYAVNAKGFLSLNDKDRKAIENLLIKAGLFVWPPQPPGGNGGGGSGGSSGTDNTWVWLTIGGAVALILLGGIIYALRR
jgi:hypothetical protein